MIAGGASLLLNVFLVGIIAGHVYTGRGKPGGGPGVGGLIQPGHVKALSPEERRKFVAAMNHHRPRIKAAREANRANRQIIVADISAPTFDRDKVKADFANLRQTNAGVGEAVDAALIDALADLPSTARAALVSRERVGNAPPNRQ